jgi:hypothetical protein
VTHDALEQRNHEWSVMIGMNGFQDKGEPTMKPVSMRCNACGRGMLSVRARQFLSLVTAQAKK